MFRVTTATSNAQAAIHPRGCLFCLRRDGGFESIEHIVAESIGNRELLLPPGVVCDRCNNGKLAVLDQALADFPGVTAMRILRGVPRKGGKLPEGAWSNARGYIDVEAGGPVIEGRDMSAWRKTPDGGTIRLHKTWGRTARERGRVGRALWKVALELLAHTDREEAYGEGLDELREAVLGVGAPHGWFGLVKHGGRPHDSVHLSLEGHVLGDDGLAVLVMDVYSLVLFTEVLHRDRGMAEGVRLAVGLGDAEIAAF